MTAPAIPPVVHLNPNAHAVTSAMGMAPAGYLSPPPPSPFSLEGGRDDDAALFQDARVGFSHLVPGRPVVQPHAQLTATDPPADAVLCLQDAPITIRYRLEHPSVAAPTTNELARLTAERYASWRAQAHVHVELTNPTWLLSWGAEAAAVATYDVYLGPQGEPLPSPVPGSHPREDLFVLVRQGMLYVVTWTYPSRLVEEPLYASFASVAEATMIWDPLRWEQRGRVWPESAFLGPGINGAIKPQHDNLARALSRAELSEQERTHLLVVLSGVVSGAGAPWVQLRPDMLDAHRHALTSALRHPQLRAHLDVAWSDVRTAHDLRGLAILLGRALDASRRSSRPAPPQAPSAPRPPQLAHLTRG